MSTLEKMALIMPLELWGMFIGLALAMLAYILFLIIWDWLN